MRNPASGSASQRTSGNKAGLKRGPWTPEEDKLLANYVNREGEGKWRTLPKQAGLLRCGKSCRLRWMNYLRPSVKRGQIAPDEEDLILRLHRLLGNRWSLIAGRIPGRTDNEIKNYWNTHLSKKLINQGIDPRTHKPLYPEPNPCQDVIAPASKSVPNANPEPNPCQDVIAPASKSVPNANPNPSSSRVIENQSSHSAMEIDGGGNQKKPPDMDQNHSPVPGDSSGNWQRADGLMRGLQITHGTSNDDEDDIEFCNDDTFSSFLNSLINEDIFGNQQQSSHVIVPLPHPAQEVQATFINSSSAIWEAAAFTSTSDPLGQGQEQQNAMPP